MLSYTNYPPEEFARIKKKGRWRVRIGPNARGKYDKRLVGPQSTRPGFRESSPRAILGFPRARGPIGVPAPMHPDAWLGYSAMGYQSRELAYGALEAQKFNLIRLVGPVAKGRYAKGNLAKKAKVSCCTCCVEASSRENIARWKNRACSSGRTKDPRQEDDWRRAITSWTVEALPFQRAGIGRPSPLNSMNLARSSAPCVRERLSPPPQSPKPKNSARPAKGTRIRLRHRRIPKQLLRMEVPCASVPSFPRFRHVCAKANILAN